MKRLILTMLLIAALALFATAAVASKSTMKCGKCPQQMAANTDEAPAGDASGSEMGCRGKQGCQKKSCTGKDCGMQKGKVNCKGGEDCKREDCGKQGKKMNCKGGKDCPKEGCNKKMNCKAGKDCPKQGCGKKMKCRGGEGCDKENCGKQGKEMKGQRSGDCPGRKDCPKQPKQS